MRYAVVSNNRILARSATRASAFRAARKAKFENPQFHVVSLNRAAGGKERISASKVGALVAFRPIGYIQRFNDYRGALGGARFDKPSNSNIAPLNIASSIVEKLQAAGFDVQVQPDLAEALKAGPAEGAIELPPSKGLIKATKDRTNAVFRIEGRVDDFNAFKQATFGAKYNGVSNVAPLTIALGIIKKLSDAGFSVDVSPDLAETLKGLAVRVQEDTSKGKQRAEELDAKLKEKGLFLFDYQKEGIAWLSGRQNAMLLDDQGTGKAQPVSEKVLTPDGWVPIGSLKVGDLVIGSAGTPVKVTGVFPQGMKKVFFVTLSNGAQTRCCMQHLWYVTEDIEHGARSGVLCLEEIVGRGLRMQDGHRRWSIPVSTISPPRVMGIVPYQWVELDSVMPAGEEECICIRVDAEEHLYVTKDYILTHNTIQTLVSLPDNAPVVVVCPAVVKGVWKNEAAKWRPEFKVTILSGKKSFRWPAPGEIVVTNFDVLPDADEYGEAPPGTVIVGDEAQKLKAGRGSARGRRFIALANRVREQGGRTWALSGTPLLNKPDELWNLLEMFGVAQEAFGSKSAFARLYGGVLVEGYGRIPTHWEWTGTPTPEAPEKLKRVSLRRRKEDVLTQIPAKLFQDIPVELSVKERAALEKELAKAGIDIEDILGAIESAASGKSSLPPFTGLSKAREILAKAKIPKLLELIEDYEETEEPVIVFSAHRAPIDALGQRPGWATITGDVSPEKRTEIVADFQAGKLKGVAATISAAGTGITLTNAKTGVFVDQDWTPGNNAQAQDRICRIGAKTGGCNYKIMIADHAIDERVNEILARKRAIIDAGVDASSVIHVKEAILEEVDFDALSAQARREAEAADRRAREIAEAREKLAAMGKEERERVERERDREREEERKHRSEEGRTRRAEARAAKLEDESSPERRQAANAKEAWAENAITQLAALDPDYAQKENFMGFSKSDGGAGHWLAGQIAAGQGLTTGQWKLTLGLARRYRGQVGEPPSE